MARPLHVGSSRARTTSLRLAPEQEARVEEIRRRLDESAAARNKPEPSMADAIRYAIERAPLPRASRRGSSRR